MFQAKQTNPDIHHFAATKEPEHIYVNQIPFKINEHIFVFIQFPSIAPGTPVLVPLINKKFGR